jgi:4-azaleucine resistance transporter AzlC
MTTLTQMQHYSLSDKLRAFLQGALTVLPLTIAVIPWGILAGSFALDAGLNPLQSQAMSAFVFAGAAQLVALGMVKAGVGLGSIILTTLLITSRHLLYSMALRNKICPLPFKWRATLGFLLTDELFAIANQGDQHQFDRWHALGGGLSFYISWNLASLAGIMAGQSIDNIADWGLDFAIAATFIALVVPTIKKRSTLICVLVSLVSACVFELFQVNGGLLISALMGMSAGYFYARFTNEKVIQEKATGEEKSGASE